MPFVFQYVLTDMVSDNPDELAVAAHNAMEQLQQNGHSLPNQVRHSGYSTRVKKILDSCKKFHKFMATSNSTKC